MRLRNMLIMWLAAGLVGAALAGCSKEEPSATGGGAGSVRAGAPQATGSKKKIVFVFKVGGISYSEACKRGAQQANDDPNLNVQVEYQAPTVATSEKQSEIIEQAIIGKADAIVVSPNDAKAIVPVLDKAASQGIKVFTWDSDAPTSKRLFYVAAVDDVQIGTDIADALAKSMNSSGKVLIFSGGRTAENLNKHIQGMEIGFKKYPGIQILQPYIYNDDDKNKATTMAVQALQAHPDATGIACANSPSPPAAGEAIRKLNLIGKVKVWGLALPSETKPYLLDGSVTGLYLWDPTKLTYLTARLVKDALDGKMPQDGQEIEGGKMSVKDGVVTLPLRLEITKENVEKLNF
ncbi:MAG TPA: autoinducer 2 ABC transporter substrate-binding protein [Chthonomonadaceae bacterium]|nr:autoinducer 2 ABC transporter substrate-binding protein [Chthonomonadaceae bacterium]